MNKKHSLNSHPLYSKWGDMKTRCYNPKSQRYKNYGGRGILVCDEWKNNFMAYYDWAINNGWKEGLSIDRIDVNKGYSPCNCRMATFIEQSRNKTTSVTVNYRGQNVLFAELCASKGFNQRQMRTIYERMRVKKWSADKAIDTPIRLFRRS